MDNIFNCARAVNCRLTTMSVSRWHYQSLQIVTIVCRGHLRVPPRRRVCPRSPQTPVLFLGRGPRAGRRKKKSNIPRRIPREVYRSHAWNRIHRSIICRQRSTVDRARSIDLRSPRIVRRARFSLRRYRAETSRLAKRLTIVLIHTTRLISHAWFWRQNSNSPVIKKFVFHSSNKFNKNIYRWRKAKKFLDTFSH